MRKTTGKRALPGRPEPEKQALRPGSGRLPGKKENEPNEAQWGLPAKIGLILLILLILCAGFFGVWALNQMNHNDMERFPPDSSVMDFIDHLRN